MCANCEIAALMAFICLRLDAGADPADINEALQEIREVHAIEEGHELTHMAVGTA